VTASAQSLWDEFRRAHRDRNADAVESLAAEHPPEKLPRELKLAVPAALALYADDAKEAKALLKEKELAKLNGYERLIKGLVALEEGKFEAAEKSLRKAKKMELQDPRLHSALALIRVGLGHPRKGEHLARASVDRDPKHWHGHFVLGISLVHQEHLEMALESFEKVTDQNPDFEQAWLELGAVAIQLKRPKVAVEYLQKAVARHPRKADLRVALAHARSEDGDLEGAARALSPVAAQTRDPDLVMDHVELLLPLGRHDDAQAALKRVASLESQPSSRQHFLLGATAELADPEGFAQAKAHYEAAVAEDPLNFRAKSSLGLLLMRDTPIQDFDRADRLLEEVCTTSPTAASMLNLAILKVSQKDVSAAKRWAMQSLGVAGADPGVAEQARTILKALGAEPAEIGEMPDAENAALPE
jgi:tetratricopeptide (TPR) repeat protein